MATTATEIVDKLIALTVATAFGTDIFIGQLPDSPDAAVCVYEYPGRPADYNFGTKGVGFENPSIQVVVRGAPYDYAGARAKAETAYRGLAAVEAETLGSTFYHFIHPKPPFPLRRDDRERTYMVVNCDVTKEPSV